MKKSLAAISSALLLSMVVAGCATQPEMVWDKPGSTEQEFYTDTGQCRAQAFASARVPLIQAVIIYESCLQGKGWYRVPAQR